MLPDLRTEIPGPRSRALAARLRAAESRNITYLDAEFPIFWELAEGMNVWDADGNRFLDFTSAFAVASLGHGATAGALATQAGRLLHAMGDVHPTEEKVRLCERLGEMTFGRWLGRPGKVILGCNGSDAIEAALKTAVLASGRSGVLTFENGYHGLGYGALTAGGMPRFQLPFRAQLADWATLLPYPHCFRCPFGRADLARIEEKVEGIPACQDACAADFARALDAAFARGNIGAVLVEPAQGRGGDVFPPAWFLPALRAACDVHGALLVFDEIYTGFHRTGPRFAADAAGVVPDLICLGKALTGGFPLSACVGRSEVMDAWPESTGEALHTSTYLGHPGGCAMALASLDALEAPGLADEVLAKGRALRDALRELNSPKIGDVRGRGLMIGAEIVMRAPEDLRPDPASSIRAVKAALRAGLILLAGGPAGNVLSISPPFIVSDEEIAWAAATIGEGLASAEAP